MTRHPGTVTFVEIHAGKIVNAMDRPVETLPESLHFETIDSKRVPIVRIETIHDDAGPREILKYGPRNKFISSTIVARPR